MTRPLQFATVAVAAMLFASSAVAADNELSDEEKQAGWQLLFNGKDVTGWKCNNGKPIATPVEERCDGSVQVGRVHHHSRKTVR